MPESRNAGLNLLAQEHRRFLSFLRSRVRSEGEAEEILQSAYAKGLRHLSDNDKPENLVAWFFRLLRNSLIDHYRHNAVEAKALALYAKEPQAPDPALEKAVCACMKKLVKTIKPEYAEALNKVDLEGMEIKDYAKKTGVTPNNAAVRIHRARQSLKKRLVETCGACAQHGCLDCSCKH